jgi:Protein of unknown function (DUF3515)
VVVVFVVLVNVLGGDADGDGTPPATVEGTTPSQRPEDLPVLDVETPDVDPATEGDCEALLAEMPFELGAEPARRVRSDWPYVYAWGEPATVLVCGVPRPEDFTVTSGLIQINGVNWFVDTSDPETTVWTAVDRPAYVEVRVPAGTDSAGVTQLSTPIAQVLDRTELDPAEG